MYWSEKCYSFIVKSFIDQIICLKCTAKLRILFLLHLSLATWSDHTLCIYNLYTHVLFLSVVCKFKNDQMYLMQSHVVASVPLLYL